MKLLYLNVKPQREDEEHPDNWQNIESLGLSVAATYNVATQSQRIYEEKDVKRLLDQLLNSDLVVTFNGHDFDYRILNAYTTKNLFQNTKAFHMLEHVEGDLWQRLSLANLARQNLDKSQTTTVKHQILCYQNGIMRVLRNAVEYDLDSIIKLFKLGCKRKFLHYWCPDTWTQKSFKTDSWAKNCRDLTFVTKNYRRW